MKNAKRTILRTLSGLLVIAMLLLSFTACSGQAKDGMYAKKGLSDLNGENYYEKVAAEEADGALPEDIVENPFVETSVNNVSTFSADVDTASYTYFRKTVNGWVSQKANKQTILSSLENIADSLRTEEFLNYFKYTANKPEGDNLFGVTASVIPCPWNSENKLLRLTLQAPATVEATAGNNLVFLIDVSGSMQSSDKLPLLQKAFTYLTEQLTAQDRVSIVTYSGEEKVVLTGCSGNDKESILNAINSLEANGSTNGESGLKKAYQLASDYFITGGNNRIIMASDGDLNVGISSAEELKAYVESERDRGIYLSVLGFGTGNYRDSNMEALADNGNGVYYYIDGETEAKKVFGDDLFSTLYTVAKDVKLQLTFSTDLVSAYRQIGYENRQLAEEDFTDDTKDAGDVGAGHQVTVFYELKLVDKTVGDGAETQTVASSADGKNSDGSDGGITVAPNAYASLSVRYKKPDESVSKENTYTIGVDAERDANTDEKFMLSVMETVMVLRKSEYLSEDFTLENVLKDLNAMNLDGDSARTEFRSLVKAIADGE